MAKVIFSKDPSKYIPALAESLQNIPEFEVPEWAFYVKSGTHKERPPVDENFWYTRAAAILRQLYLKGVVGVGKLRTRFGGRKDRGTKPDQFRKAGGKIIRLILQQAEKAGLVEKVNRMQHGRRLTQKGRDLLDSIDVEEEQGLDYANVKIAQRTIQQPIDEEMENDEEIEEPQEETEEEEEDGQ